MESVQTKETSAALNALTKHKSRGNKPQNVAVQPVAIVVETPKIEVAATTPQTPVNPPATPAVTPEPQAAGTRNYEESYKHLKTHHDKTTHELREEVKSLRDNLAKANSPKLELPKTKEEIEAYRKQYPEAMDVFQTIAIETVATQSKELRDQLEEIKRFQAEIREKDAFKKLLEIHPDALEIRSSVKFLEWYNEQPLAMQKILSESTDITAVAKQLTLYKLEVLGINPKEQKAAEIKSNIDASLGVDIRGKTVIDTQKKRWTQTEINAICANYNTWLQYRVELDDAKRENRIDYDK